MQSGAGNWVLFVLIKNYMRGCIKDERIGTKCEGVENIIKKLKRKIKRLRFKIIINERILLCRYVNGRHDNHLNCCLCKYTQRCYNKHLKRVKWLI